MMDAFRPRRHLLCRRLWRSRCCAASGKNKDDMDGLQQQKALVRQLTRILSTSQLDTLVRVVERCKYKAYHYFQVFHLHHHYHHLFVAYTE